MNLKELINFISFAIQAASATPDRIDLVQKIIVRNSLENRGKDRRTRIIVVIKTSYTVVFHILMKINDFTESIFNSLKRVRKGDNNNIINIINKNKNNNTTNNNNDNNKDDDVYTRKQDVVDLNEIANSVDNLQLKNSSLQFAIGSNYIVVICIIIIIVIMNFTYCCYYNYNFYYLSLSSSLL